MNQLKIKKSIKDKNYHDNIKDSRLLSDVFNSVCLINHQLQFCYHHNVDIHLYCAKTKDRFHKNIFNAIPMDW